jgi:hypothetical protein
VGATFHKASGALLPGIEQAGLKTFTYFVESRPASYLCDMEGYWLARAHKTLKEPGPLYLFKVISDNSYENLLASQNGKQRLAEYLSEHAQYLIHMLTSNSISISS